MVGLEGHRPDLVDYQECIKIIEEHVQRYTADELEEMNWRIKQAGTYSCTEGIPAIVRR